VFTTLLEIVVGLSWSTSLNYYFVSMEELSLRFIVYGCLFASFFYFFFLFLFFFNLLLFTPSPALLLSCQGCQVLLPVSLVLLMGAMQLLIDEQLDGLDPRSVES